MGSTKVLLRARQVPIYTTILSNCMLWIDGSGGFILPPPSLLPAAYAVQSWPRSVID